MPHEVDLVDPDVFLDGCGLPQYRECLMTNLGDGRGLHRSKLAVLRIHHLSHMNITQFDHQKLIMQRIRQLSHIESLPVLGVGSDGEAAAAAAVPVVLRRGSRDPMDGRRSSLVRRPKSRGDTAGKKHGNPRRSKRGSTSALDKSWESIQKTRAQIDGGAKKRQLDQIRRRSINARESSAAEKKKLVDRGGSMADEEALERATTASDPGSVAMGQRVDTADQAKEGRPQRRRSNSLDPAAISSAMTARQKAMEYGNNALRSNTLEHQLKEIKTQVLEEFRSTIDCDRATLMFLDKRTQELFFYDGHLRVHFPMAQGVAGYCATTGERLTVNDPYNDSRFNPQIDKDTGFHTRNILCEPVKSRSGGNVLAVLQMVNKKNGADFTEQDAEVMEIAVLKVSQALETRYSALINLKNDWARRNSTNSGPSALAGSGGSSQPQSRYLGDQQSPGAGQQASSQSLDARMSMSRRPSTSGSRRGSAASREEAEKLRRRKEYGKEVRDSAVGLG